jgi:hypothetical protein
MHSGEHLHLSLRIAIDAVRLQRLKCVLFITRNVVRLGREKLLRRGTCRSRSPVSRKQNRDICIFGTHTAHMKHRVQNNCEPEELAGVQHYFSWEMTLRANVPLKSSAQIGTPSKGYLPETARLNDRDRCRPGPNWRLCAPLRIRRRWLQAAGGSSGLLHKGSWVSGAPVELWMLRCTHKIQSAGSSTKWSCGQLSASGEIPRGGHFNVQTGSLTPFCDRRHREHSKGFGLGLLLCAR